jgi:hypothetical protein
MIATDAYATTAEAVKYMVQSASLAINSKTQRKIAGLTQTIQ